MKNDKDAQGDKNVKPERKSSLEYDRLWREKNRERLNAGERNRYQKNKQKKLESNKKHYQEKKEKIKAKRRAYYKENKDRISVKWKIKYKQDKQKHLDRCKAYNNANSEKVKAKRKEYYRVNKDKIIRRGNKYQSNRIKTDPLFCAKCKLRWAVTHSFRRIKQNKPTNTENLLGCTWLEAKEQFEKLFKEGMSWENHGEWEIDHIRPVHTFKDSELHLINLIDNLQPLWADEHLKKTKLDVWSAI